MTKNTIYLILILCMFIAILAVSCSSDKVITPPPTNTPPTITKMFANPGVIKVCPNYQCNYGMESVITCEATDNEDGKHLLHSWDAISQGTAGNISPKTGYGTMAVFNASTSGLYVVTCTVTDSGSLSDSYSVDIAVCDNCMPTITIVQGHRR